MPAQSPRILAAPAMAPDEPNREQHKRDLAVEVLQTAGQVRLAARGYSMLPSLWPGDVLTLRTAQLDEVSAGDLVLFQREGNFFIHRVLRRQQINAQMYLITRGDSMPRSDAPVSSAELLGKVISVERNGQDLPRVPACTPLVRSIGLSLGSWSPLRSVVLLWRKRRPADAMEDAPNGVASLQSREIS